MIFAPPRNTAAPPQPSAVELDLPADELLPLLGRFEAPAIVVRCGGISLFRKGALGRGLPRLLTNPPSRPMISHFLSLDPDSVRRICLLRDHGSRSSLEIEVASCGFALSVWCGDNRQDDEILRHLLATTPARSLAIESLNRAGAAAWLDDFPPSPPCLVRSRFLYDQESREASLSLLAPGLSAWSSFVPTFIDRDGETLRLANTGGDRVIHIRTKSASSPFPRSLSPLW